MTVTLFGIKFEISFPLVAIMTAVIILDTSRTILICFTAAIIHESGHITALGLFRSYPERIKLTLFDAAIIDRKKALRSRGKQLVVTLGGIIYNVLSIPVLYLIYRLTGAAFTKELIYANITLAVFNSLPVYSLDGGEALLIILSRFFDTNKANNIVDLVSFIVLLPIEIIGFMVLLRSIYNFTLLLSGIYLMCLLIYKRKKRIVI